MTRKQEKVRHVTKARPIASLGTTLWSRKQSRVAGATDTSCSLTGQPLLRKEEGLARETIQVVGVALANYCIVFFCRGHI